MYIGNHESKFYILCIVLDNDNYSEICTVLIIPGELCDVTIYFVSCTGIIEEGFTAVVHLCHLFTCSVRALSGFKFSKMLDNYSDMSKSFQIFYICMCLMALAFRESHFFAFFNDEDITVVQSKANYEH